MNVNKYIQALYTEHSLGRADFRKYYNRSIEENPGVPVTE